MKISVTRKQFIFMRASSDEVLFGGAAGGGKSYGQIVDALIYALSYPMSKQLVLRRTYRDLEKSIIRTVREVYPRSVFDYNASSHVGKFKNGSIVDFGYCASEDDVYQYQGAEYDVIRFDELTHFTEFMYTYLMSRLRGANGYPKQMKSSTNPGNIGHGWVKRRFISPSPPNTVFAAKDGTRVFIPSLVTDNKYLLSRDPAYVKRLNNLPEKERRALLCGDWDIFDGQYFSEFRRDVHVIKPIPLDDSYKHYVAIDYGLDCFAACFFAVDSEKNVYVYGEIHEKNLIISEAARRLKERMKGENVSVVLAPPDLFSRRQETGRSVKDIFYENGIALVPSSNDRVAGWLAVKEYLKTEEVDGVKTAKLKIFDNCLHLIDDLPMLVYDERNASDVSTEPHDITHSCDALRYFCVYWTMPKKKKIASKGVRLKVV